MTECNVKNRTIFCRDNLDVLRGINSECIDLIYLDPPFNKNKKFTAPIGSSAEGAEFSDIFRKEDVKSEWLLTIKEDQPELFHYLNGIRGVGNPYNFAYLAYMAIRLIECRRVLRQTGSIYLHCDPTMSHYLKAVMDCVFGEKCFRNEIIWQRYGSHNDARKYGNVTDTLLFYSTPRATWSRPHIPFSDEDITERYSYQDDRGVYTTSPLHARTLSGGGYAYEWRGITDIWKFPKERLDELESDGRIHWPKRGNVPRRKVYLSDSDGKPLSNLWIDIGIASGNERTGYPTQKPLALLDRVIKASSNEGNIVLDPFCGCATTCVAAEHLNRQWIGIDISIVAYDLVRHRLTDEVADPGNILQFRNQIHLKTDPPRRTDQGKDYQERKFVYVISHPAYPGEYKVGIAKNVKSRLVAYQTADPERAYRIEYKIETPHFRELENYIHDVFPNKHEWMQADLRDIIEEMSNYKGE